MPYVKRRIPPRSGAAYPATMAHPLAQLPTLRICRALFGLAIAVVPARMAVAADARLVRCGSETCLRLAGHRADAAVAVRVAGQALAVQGGRAWRATVPLATARDWPNSGGTLRLTLADPATGAETTDAAVVPPGSLGRRVKLATLTVSAH